METLDRMVRAIDYLEENISGKVDVAEAARVACSSSFHFQRMFHILTGYTVAEYVRCRRLTHAAQELSASATSVFDVALKYGYDSPEAFSKAFRKLHGLSPTAARSRGAVLRHFPRISFQLQIKGDKPMDYRIEEKPAFTVVGSGIRVNTANGENLKVIPEFWGKFTDYENLCKLQKADGVVGIAMLGVCANFDPALEQFTYLIAVESAPDADFGSYEHLEVPAATWAVFDSVGPVTKSIQAVWQRIFAEFFPSSGYEHASGLPEFERYPPGDVDGGEYRCEVWIPVVKK
ncbi:MAG TPA: AraC family transcriptional regulator [Capsulimonadaceae bacterium]|jgi:AraC family transcriptional regulator